MHLTHHGHGLHLVGGLVAVHVAGMFCPSPLSGWLADRIGGERLGHVGLVVLALTAAGWAATDATDGLWSGAFLLTLGLGWNAAVVGGSALVTISKAEASDRIEVEAGVELAKEAGAGVGAGASEWWRRCSSSRCCAYWSAWSARSGSPCSAVAHGGHRHRPAAWGGTAVPAATDDRITAIDLVTNLDCPGKPT